jgi:hypothetical protein
MLLTVTQVAGRGPIGLIWMISPSMSSTRPLARGCYLRHAVVLLEREGPPSNLDRGEYVIHAGYRSLRRQCRELDTS